MANLVHTRLTVVVMLLIGSCVTTVTDTEPPAEAARVLRLTRPQQCAQFIRVHSDNEWNPATESYPVNHEWQDCMGVGYE